jgi:hypothetical protein
MSAKPNPERIVEEGHRILDAVLLPHGFAYRKGLHGKHHAGDFARGEYVRGDRRIEIHFRHSLGLVTYYLGDLQLVHADYMRALLGAQGGNRYPGFYDDPMEAFRELAFDLEHFCSDFLSGDGAEFKRCAQTVLPSGLDAI